MKTRILRPASAGARAPISSPSKKLLFQAQAGGTADPDRALMKGMSESKQ
ncbi:MAG: hypothetical protein ABIY46_01820 [Gemmatimonadales bacterium]